jgi:integrase
MARRKKMIILPTLNNCGGDVQKKWFVMYSVRHPKTDKMHLFKIYSPLGKFHDAVSRTRAAEQLIKDFAEKLKHGWSPFVDDSHVIYEDHLEYDHITRIYGKKRAENKTIRYWASKYLETLSGKLDEDGTLPTYKSKLRIFSQWIDSHYSGNDATTITNATMVDFFRWLIDHEKRSAKTIHDYRYILAGLFNWLIQKKVFVSNPVHDLPECTRVTDQAPVPIHEFDIAIFKEELVNDPQLWMAVQFQYYCALRPGRELRLLRIQDIDFARGQVTVMRTQAKTKITRTVVIPAVFLQVLRNEFHLMKYKKDFYVFGKNGEPGPENLGKNNLRFRFNAIRKKLKMPLMYKFYSWKHTGAVEASLSGIPDKHIQMQLGHTSLETTSRYLRKMTGFQSDFLKNKYPEI